MSVSHCEVCGDALGIEPSKITSEGGKRVFACGLCAHSARQEARKAGPTLEEVLRAIKARVTGVWDDPALVKHGPLLPDAREDCLNMINAFFDAKEGHHG